MGRKKKSAEEPLAGTPPAGERAARWRAILRLSLASAGLVLVGLAVAYTAWSADQLLRYDVRFHLPADNPLDDSSPIELRGHQRVTAEELLAVFAADRGTSLYQLDLEARRAALRQVPWVRDAAVRRIWPNRLAVEVVERTPAAFIKLAGEPTGSLQAPVSFRPWLIDGDGVLLPPREGLPPDLPLLTGVQPNQPLELRRDRVLRLQRLLADLAEYRSRILEVDLGEPQRPHIKYDTGELHVTLVFGRLHTAIRMKEFETEYPRLRERLRPNIVIDLSAGKHITIGAGAEGGI
jgi:cell division protein FtsQ